MIIRGREGATGQIEFTAYGLTKMIKTLEIEGVDYDPKMIADKADLDDSDTIKVLLTIGRLLDEACFVSIDVKKSSATSAKQSRQGSDAQNAQDRMGASDPKVVAAKVRSSNG